MLQPTSSDSVHGLEGLTFTVYPLKGKAISLQETVKDCPGLWNCTVGVAGGGGGSVKQKNEQRAGEFYSHTSSYNKE